MHVQRYTLRRPSSDRVNDGNRPLCDAPASEPYDHAELADCPRCTSLLSMSDLAWWQRVSVRIQLDTIDMSGLP